MAAYQSHISPTSAAFAANRAEMLGLIDELRALERRSVELSEQRRPRFLERNQLTPRERLHRLLDPGMPFLELHSLANYLVEDRDSTTSVPGASMITGIGFVAGARCMIWVDDSGIRAGAMTESSLPKALSILALAKRQKLPLLHLVESAGANLMAYRVEGWARGGALFFGLARLSAAGIPTIAVLHGPSTAGGAYMPGLSDYVIGVRGNGMAALGGVALVFAATGEVADEAALGGAEMHAGVSGLVEHLADDDAQGIAMARDTLARLDWNRRCTPAPLRSFREPVYDPDELAGVVPADYRKPYDVREVVARVVDGSEIGEFKARYGSATVCLHGSIYGHACGLLGNNGPIDPDGAAKATQFLQLCEQADLPVVFLNNTTGYMVGTAYEQAGMIKHGSKMIQAVSNLRTPKLTLYIGASFGAGNYGMCGLAYEPDFLFAWPNATTGVMGGEQAARTMSHVARAGAKRKSGAVDEEALREQETRLIRHFDSQSGAFYTSGRVLDHGVIDPRDTRKVLGFALETCWEARHRTVTPNSFGVARI